MVVDTFDFEKYGDHRKEREISRDVSAFARRPACIVGVRRSRDLLNFKPRCRRRKFWWDRWSSRCSMSFWFDFAWHSERRQK